MLTREMQIALLDDENGICNKAWHLMYDLWDADIRQAARCSDGRWYLPLNWE